MNWLVYSYKYLFFRIFCFSRRINRGFLDRINKEYSKNLIAHNSYLILTWCLTMYFDSFMRLIDGKAIFDYQKYQLFVFMGIVYIFNLLFFNRVAKYESIVDHFSKESKISYYISTILALLFVGFAMWPILILLF